MTNENTEIKEVPLDEVQIGEDKPQIEAKTVLVEDYELQPIKKKGTDEEIGKKLVLKVKHPDISDRQIEISGAKYEQNGKIKTSGLWVKTDNDGKLPFNSAVAHVLRFKGKTAIKQLKGEQMATSTDDAGYLCVKAY